MIIKYEKLIDHYPMVRSIRNYGYHFHSDVKKFMGRDHRATDEKGYHCGIKYQDYNFFVSDKSED